LRWCERWGRKRRDIAGGKIVTLGIIKIGWRSGTLDMTHGDKWFNPILINSDGPTFANKVECTIGEDLGNQIRSLPFIFNFFVGFEKKSAVDENELAGVNDRRLCIRIMLILIFL
jgi:hypothetical protein